jgi:hypothetical protein
MNYTKPYKKSNYKYYPRANQHIGQHINKTRDLLDFIFKGPSHNSLDIRPNLEIALDLTTIITTISTHITIHQNCTTAKQTEKHSKLKSKKMYYLTSHPKQRKTSKRLLQKSCNTKGCLEHNSRRQTSS